jgi:LPS O-antigen subunit length determinant protein (WzzB/FepE family)
MSESKEFNDSYLSIHDIYKFFLKNIWIIIITTSIASACTVVYSLSLNNIYQSKSILITNSSLSRINQSNNSGISGLSSLASFGLGSSTEGLTNLDLAYETFISRTFFEKLAEDHNFVRDLHAANSYNSQLKELEYDEGLYDIALGKWTNQKPSNEMLYKKFNSQNLFVARDRKKGFIILSIRSISPELSYDWHKMIVDKLNDSIRKDELEKSTKNIAFLKNLSEKETNFSMKQIITSMMGYDLKKIMLSNSSKDYSLEYLDKPFIPEKKVLPRRSIICILGFISGFIISIFISIIRSLIRR